MLQLRWPVVGILLFLTSIASAGVTIPTGYGNEIELYSQSYALIVGVSDYQTWPDLPGVKEDVEQVRQSLEKRQFQVETVLNPTRPQFDQAMRSFIARYGQDNRSRLLFYFAGHGHTLKTQRGRELGFIIPADTPLPQQDVGRFKERAISMLEIEIYAKQIESKHAMFLFDSCFSGSLFELTRALPAAISDKTTKPVRQFITAGTADQEVPDKSIFRRQFIFGLEGEADLNKDGFITGTEIAQYVGDTVTNYSRRAQTPRYGKIRDPQLDKGDFVFISPKSVSIEINVPEQGKIDPLAVELAYWESIKHSDDPAVYRAYLKKYPAGEFAELAKLRLQMAQDYQSNRDARPQAPDTAATPAKPAPVDNQVAHVDTATRVSGFSPQYKKIAVISRGEVALSDSLTNDEYSARIAAAMKQQLQSFTNGNVELVTFSDESRNRELLFEGKDYRVSKSFCRETGADLLVSGLMEMNWDTGDGLHAGTGMEYVIYDCHKQQKVNKGYSVSYGPVNEDFNFSRDIHKYFTEFLADYGSYY